MRQTRGSQRFMYEKNKQQKIREQHAARHPTDEYYNPFVRRFGISNRANRTE